MKTMMILRPALKLGSGPVRYLYGLRQVLEGQVEPDAELQREDVLPLRSLMAPAATTQQHQRGSTETMAMVMSQLYLSERS